MMHITGWDWARLIAILGFAGWGAMEGVLFVWRHLSFGWLP